MPPPLTLTGAAADPVVSIGAISVVANNLATTVAARLDEFGLYQVPPPPPDSNGDGIIAMPRTSPS